MKTGDSETEDTGTPRDTGTASDRGDNVVRLPREWIGPLEELVPIRPATPAGEQPADAVDDELPATADAFWSEDAGALHNPVQAPVDRSGDVSHAGAERRAERPGRQIGIGRPTDRFRSRFGQVRLRQLGVAAVAVPLVAMAVIGSLWGSAVHGGAPNTGQHRSARATAIGHGLGQIARHKLVPENAVDAHRSSSASATRRARAWRTRAGRSARHANSQTTARQRPARQPTHSPAGSRSPAEQVSVTPVRSSSSSVSSPSSGAGTATETPAAPIAAPTASSAEAGSGSSASSGGASAFGPSGTLGPGSSPNS